MGVCDWCSDMWPYFSFLYFMSVHCPSKNHDHPPESPLNFRTRVVLFHTWLYHMILLRREISILTNSVFLHPSKIKWSETFEPDSAPRASLATGHRWSPNTSQRQSAFRAWQDFECCVTSKMIINVVACEGVKRITRHETFEEWEYTSQKAAFKVRRLIKEVKHMQNASPPLTWLFHSMANGLKRIMLYAPYYKYVLGSPCMHAISSAQCCGNDD